MLDCETVAKMSGILQCVLRVMWKGTFSVFYSTPITRI
jgi:hypothetical protein